MSDTPIFDEMITETLDPDHAVFSLDPAAVLETSSETAPELIEDPTEDSSPEETSSDSEGASQ